MNRACVRESRQLFGELVIFAGLGFDGGQAVVWPQHLGGDQWRTRISPVAKAAHDVDVARQHAGHGGERQQPQDAFASLSGFLRLSSSDVIDATPCMGIDHREGLVLFAQMQKHGNQCRVLQHIGEISGVVNVAVVHA